MLYRARNPKPKPSGKHSGKEKREPSHLTELAHFGRLYLQCCSFGHYPELMTIGEGRNKDQPINWKCLFWLSCHFLHYCRRRTDLPVHLPLHSSLTREPRGNWTWSPPPPEDSCLRFWGHRLMKPIAPHYLQRAGNREQTAHHTHLGL